MTLPRSKTTAFWLALIASNSDTTIRVVAAENPSGSCTADDNGGRAGYHSPGPNDTYLPDCLNPLQRELWRVFEKEDGTAYMIPRPDGLGIKYNLCTSKNDEVNTGIPPLVDDSLAKKAEQYGLCDEIVSDPSLLNNMDPSDALQFANIFHRQLYFVANSAGDDAGIDPWVPDTDILAACEIITDDMTDAKAYCEEVAGKCGDNGECIDIGIIPSTDAVAQLLPALNEIYGTVNQGSDCLPGSWGEPHFGCAVAKCVEAPDGCEYVFDHYVITANRDCCPELCYAVDSDGKECSFSTTEGNSGAQPYISSSWSLLFIGGLLLPILN